MRHDNYIHDRALELFRRGTHSLDDAITTAAMELAEIERKNFSDADERPQAPGRLWTPRHPAGRMVGSERRG